MDSMQGGAAATTFCPVCAIHLSYPAGSTLIQCPACQHTIDPNVPQQTRCTRCKTLLAYPPNSLFIQCPKCMETMDPRAAAMGAAGAGGHQMPGQMNPHQMNSLMPQHHQVMNHQQQKQSKKRRDPNAPKAVSNAYMIFCKARRAELKQENPDLPFGKIGARLGEIWRTMTPEQKKPYEDKATTDRERYRKEMLDYQIGKHQPESKKTKTDDQEGDEADEDDEHDEVEDLHRPRESGGGSGADADVKAGSDRFSASNESIQQQISSDNQQSQSSETEKHEISSHYQPQSLNENDSSNNPDDSQPGHHENLQQHERGSLPSPSHDIQASHDQSASGGTE